MSSSSSSAEQRMIKLAALDRQHTQLRVRMSPDAVSDYAASYEDKNQTMPPIVAFEDPDDGTLYLGDGFHRVESLLSIGRKKVSAEIRSGTLDDAILFAANCNKHNAVRWTNRDKLKAVKALLARFPNMRQRKIAAACGCSQGARFQDRLRQTRPRAAGQAAATR